MANDYDAVMAYSSAMVPYALRLKRGPRLLDMVDVDSAKWEQYARTAAFPRRVVFAREANRLRQVEVAAVQKFDSVLVATSREQEVLRNNCDVGQIERIRNGVASEFFDPPKTGKSEIPTVAFMGQMDYLPNIDAAEFFSRQVLPQLRKKIPGLRFLIIGRSPTPRVLRLARIDGVEVTGAVDDVRPQLARSWIFVAPLRVAQGIQNKVLEAMAMGLPVVCSSGVSKGLEDAGFVLGEELIVADAPETVTRSILELLTVAERRERMGALARARVRESYDWNRNMTDLDGLLRDLVQPVPATDALHTNVATSENAVDLSEISR